MSQNVFGMGLVIEYTDRATSQMMNTQQVFNQTHQSAEQLTQTINQNIQQFKQLGMVSAGAAASGMGLNRMASNLTEPLSNAREEAVSFEKELAQLQFVSGKTSEEFEELKDTAIETGIETAFSPQEATQAMYSLLSAGMETKEMHEALDDTLKLVALSAGEIELGQGAELVASTLNKFNLEAEESTRVANMMARATQETAFRMEEMDSFMRGMKMAPAVLEADLEQLMAIGGLFRNMGATARRAGGAINSMAQRIGNMMDWLEEGGDNAELMEELGLTEDTLVDSEGNLRNIDHMLGAILDSGERLEESEFMAKVQDLMGRRGAQVVQILRNATEGQLRYNEVMDEYVEVGDGATQTYSDLTEVLGNVSDEAQRGEEALLESSWGIEKLLEGTRQTLSIMLGETIRPFVNTVTSAMTTFLNMFIRLANAHPILINTLGWGMGLAGLALSGAGSLLLMTGVLGGLISGLGIGINKLAMFAVKQGMINKGVIQTTTLFGKAKAMMIGFGKTALLQIGMVMAKLAPLVALSSALYMAWDRNFAGIRDSLMNFVDRVGRAFDLADRFLDMDIAQFARSWEALERGDNWVNTLTQALVRIQTTYTAVRDLISEGEISGELYRQLQITDTVELVKSLHDWYYRVTEIGSGVATFFGHMSWVVENAIGIAMTAFQTMARIGLAIVSPVLRVLGMNVEALSHHIDNIPLGIFHALGYAIAGLATIKFATWVGGVVTALAGLATTIATAVVPALASLGVALLTNPITWIVGAIVGVVAGLWWMYNNWDRVTQAIHSVMGWLADRITDILTPVAWTLRRGIQGVVNFVESAVESIRSAVSWLGSAIETIWQGIKWTISTIVSGIVGVVQTAVDGVRTAFNVMGMVVKGIWRGIRWTVETVIDTVVSVVETGIDTIKTVFGVMETVVDGIWTGIKWTVSTVMGLVKSSVETNVEIIKDVFRIMGTVVDGVWSGIQTTAGIVMDMILGVVDLYVGNIRDVFNIFRGLVTGDWEMIRDSVFSIMNRIWDTVNFFLDPIKTAFSQVGESIVGVWNWIEEQVGQVFDWLGDKVDDFLGIAEPILDFASGVGGAISEGVSGVIDFVTPDGEKQEPQVTGDRRGQLHSQIEVEQEDTTAIEEEQDTGRDIQRGGRRGQAGQIEQREETMTSITDNDRTEVHNDNHVEVGEGAIQLDVPENATQQQINDIAEELLREIRSIQEFEETAEYGH